MELERTLTRLTPIPEEELQEAVDTLSHFSERWDKTEHDPEEQHRMLRGIVERVYLRDAQIVAIVPQRSFRVVLGNEELVSSSGELTARELEAVLRLSVPMPPLIRSLTAIRY